MFNAVMNVICFVMMVSSVSTQYDFKCAHESQRKIRANWYCNSKEETYSCLLDFSHDSYKESCSYKSDFVRMGQKYIIKGSKRNVNCSANRYQPFKFFSSMFSKCVFQKSSCTEEGQFIFANDSTMEDSKCSCDYTKGYNFRVRPRNNRFCLPEQEDCMCYITLCPMDKVLTSDFECTLDQSLPSVYPVIVEVKSDQKEAVTKKYFGSYIYNLALPPGWYRMAAASVVTVLTFVTSLIGILFFVKHNVHVEMDNIQNYGEELDGHVKESKVTQTLKLTGVIVDDLEIILTELDEKVGKSIFQNEKSKGYCDGKEPLLVQEVFDILKNVEPNKINIIEGVKLINIISDSSYTSTEKDINCMPIPLAFLQCIWQIVVKEINKNNKLPNDLNSDIVKIRETFQDLDTGLTNTKESFQSLIETVTKFVDRLEVEINTLIYSKDTRTEDEVNRVQYKSKQLVNLYMRVNVLRPTYCIRYYSRDTHCFRDKSHDMYEELKKMEDAQKKFLSVFSQPTYETAAFFALFNPSEYNFINGYLKVKGINLPNLSNLNNNKFGIRPRKYLEYWAVMPKTPFGTIWSTKTPSSKQHVLFNFEIVSELDSQFLISSVRWPSWYMYMNKAASLRGQRKKKGHKREWKILRLEDGKYMICSKKWPSKFIYMDDGPLGKVIGAYGDQGANGQWDLIHANEITIRNLQPCIPCC